MALTARPWLTIAIDDYSHADRRILSRIRTAALPAHQNLAWLCGRGSGVKRIPHWQICGVPDVLYTDNGADFTIQASSEQVAADLKDPPGVLDAAASLQGRGRIERFFRTVNEMFFVRPGRFTLHTDEVYLIPRLSREAIP